MATASPSRGTDALRRRKIVVVDDDLDIQDLISAFFRSKSYDVICFKDAESAVAAANLDAPAWDVVLVDLHLPRMSGVEFTVDVKKKYPQLPVILITTSKNASLAVDAIEKGAYDFIVKPIHFPQLQISVERALHLRDLTQDISQLRDRLKNPQAAQGSMIGKSPKFLSALETARRVAKSRANIFISGETGTGKEVFARFIHAESGRAKFPFVAINCSAIPENLLESELFGHAKGAFTGAQDKKIGLFEEAGEGTLFLDEIGDLSLPLQAKLLRVLQERKIKRVGENQMRPIHCRVISATHKDIKSEVRDGRFREDLFFRLNVIPLHLPPLRERREDIIPLAESFLRRFALENESRARVFSKDALKFLLESAWRGNVRELENSIERAVILSEQAEVGMDCLSLIDDGFREKRGAAFAPQVPSDAFWIDCSAGLPQMEEVVNHFIEFAVKRNGGARDRTAKEIGIDRKTLYKRLKMGGEPGMESAELSPM